MFIISRLGGAASREALVTCCDKNMLSEAEMSWQQGGSGEGGRREEGVERSVGGRVSTRVPGSRSFLCCQPLLLHARSWWNELWSMVEDRVAAGRETLSALNLAFSFSVFRYICCSLICVFMRESFLLDLPLKQTSMCVSHSHLSTRRLGCFSTSFTLFGRIMILNLSVRSFKDIKILFCWQFS